MVIDNEVGWGLIMGWRVCGELRCIIQSTPAQYPLPLSLSLYIYIYIYVCVCVCVYVCTRCITQSTPMYNYYIYMYRCIYIYIYIPIHYPITPYALSYKSLCISNHNTLFRFVDIYIYIYIYICTYTRKQQKRFD